MPHSNSGCDPNAECSARTGRDPRGRVLVTDAQLRRLNGADGQPPVLVNYTAGMTPGQLLAQWRAALDANAIGLPQPAISGIRVYERYLYLSPPNLQTP